MMKNVIVVELKIDRKYDYYRIDNGQKIEL